MNAPNNTDAPPSDSNSTVNSPSPSNSLSPLSSHLPLNTLSLSSRIALVTGGARRTGAALVRAFAKAGASVVINARSSREAAEALAKEIEERHGTRRALVCIADITDPGAVADMFERITSHYGALDILVNNAVVRKHGPLESFTLEDWRTVMNISLDGPFLCAQHALPLLKKSPQGRIINLSGAATHVPADGGMAVTAAKAGLEGLTRALAYEFSGGNVTVNCICPGVMLADGDPPQRAIDLRAYCDPEKLPIPRFGRVDETVAAVLALSGPAFAYMTGQVIHINGGLVFGT